MNPEPRIRPEETRDHDAVRALNRATFDGDLEAELVDDLRATANPLISLVAEVDGAVAGHILFTPATLSGLEGQAMALAPMAVAPHQQNRGIGLALVRAGLERCRELGVDAVFVLGHPEYYPRFGFVPAERFGIACQFEAPAEAFMALELRPGSLAGVAGSVRYYEAFDRFLPT